MRNRSGNGWWFLLFFLIILVPGSAIWPLLLIIAVVLGVTFASIHASRKQEEQESGYTHRGFHSTQNYSSAEMAQINVWLRRWFRSHDRLELANDIDLRVHGQRYASLSSLNVYRNNSLIGSMHDFENRFPQEWDQVMAELLSKSTHEEKDDVIDAEVVETPPEENVKEEKKPEEKKEEKKESSTAQSYIDQINDLNTDITDEEISEGLYETSSLLKQIQTLSVKFPDSRPKLKKLYEYYLPILIRSLKQFDNLQSAKTDPSYQETRDKLARTVNLINAAMKKIISSMTDEDFINLSADLSTLESVLQKDGLTDDGMQKTDEETDHEQQG